MKELIMFFVRRLTKFDIEQLDDIITNHKGALSRQVFSEKYIQSVKSYLINSFLINEMPNNILYGYFNDETLISFSSVVYWSSLPHYTVDHSYVRKNITNYYSLDKSGLGHIYNAIVSDAESNNRYRWYFYRNMKWPTNKVVSQWKQYKMFNNYHIVLEDILYPKMKSNFAIFKHMINTDDLQDPLVILSGTLKQKYRNTDILPDLEI